MEETNNKTLSSWQLIESKLVDFGSTSGAYTTRPGLPSRFYDRLQQIVPIQEGIRALDLGTGPGQVAFQLLQRGATVVGVDISEKQIAEARAIAERLGQKDKVKFEVASAEQINEPDNSFDLVTAGTSWHWFNSDKVLPEVHRLLKPNGYLVIASLFYLVLHSKVANDTEQLILKYNPGWTFSGHSGMFPKLIDQVSSHKGSEFVEQFCFDYPQPFTHQAWINRMRTCNGLHAIRADQKEQFENDLLELLSKKYPEEPLLIPHRVWCVIGRKQ